MINVIGLGYIGLPISLILASNDVDVVGTDHNVQIVENLQTEKYEFYEEGLKSLLIEAKQKGIYFSDKCVKSGTYIITVPTPYDQNSKRLDPIFLINAVTEVVLQCDNEATIIIESTISPGTIDKVIRPIINNSNKVIHLAHAPERIIPGNILKELEQNPRIIGVDDIKVGEQVKSLYQSFCKSEIIITDIKTAEMAKVIENTYRDINIAFANEIAKICSSDNIDVYKVIELANKHPRVNILQPGPGVGGHCISVDPWFLVGDYPDLTNLILAARKVNNSMPEFVLKRISVIMKDYKIKDIRRVGLYGLTYSGGSESI